MSESALEMKLKEFWQENLGLKAENDRLNNYVISGHQIIENEMKAEIEKLKAELKQVIEIGVEGQREINRKAHAEITKLTRQNEIMKKALEFYVGNLILEPNGVLDYTTIEYEGETASNALQEWGGDE